MNTTEWVWEQCRKAAKIAWREMVRLQRFDMYLYYQPGGLRPFFDDPLSKEWGIAINERLPCNLTEDQLTCWIHDRIGRVPFLPAQ